MRFLGQFKDAFAIDGSVVKLCKRLENIFKSVHETKSSLKLNVKGKRLSEIKDSLKEQTQLDLMVQLSKAKRPKFTSTIRLVGLLYEGQWRFYITNIFDKTVTVQLIYELSAMRWQVEIFFNAIKNVLNLKNIIKNKNGIMIEIYSALIFCLWTRIVIALAAKKVEKPIHLFSFERSFKLVKGFFLANIQLFFRKSLDALDSIFQTLIDAIAVMGLRQKIPQIVEVNQCLSP